MSQLTPLEFYFKTPLYTKIIIDVNDFNELKSLLLFDKTIDFFNPKLKEKTTYKVFPSRYGSLQSLLLDGGWNYSVLECKRSNDSFTFFYYLEILRGLNQEGEEVIKKFILQKIGQYPSIADFHINEVKKYSKVLDDEKLTEFTRAIGLAANGVGIGSFVYLRRIFEFLIDNAKNEEAKIEGWDEEGYKKLRIADRIEMLKYHLPEFLVENKKLYGIISTGIHSLSENECLAYFETIRTGIELILDEQLERIERTRKIDQATRAINSIKNKGA